MATNEDIIRKIKASSKLSLKVQKYLRPEIYVRPYQVIGATLLWFCRNFLLADACGLGKTLQMLLAYAIQKEMDEVKGLKPPRLVVATEKSALLQWADELQHFFTGITALPVKAGVKRKGFSKPHDYREHLYNTSEEDVFIIAHRTFAQDWKKGVLLDLVKDSILVLDEADLIRSVKSQAYKSFQSAAKVSRGFKALTATPIYTSLEDYYNLMCVMAPGLFGNYESFLRYYCVTKPLKITTKAGGKMWIKVIEGFRNVEHFHEKASPYLIQRTPDDVGEELPKLLEKPVYVEMEPAQARAYQKAAEGEFNLMPGVEEPRKKSGGELETVEEVQERVKRTEESKLVTQIRCLQAAGHPRLLDQEGSSVKLAKLLQLLQGGLKKQHVVVFSQFKKLIDILEIELGEAKIETCRVTGDESLEQRNDAMQRFRTEAPPYVMLLTTAGKKALNLQAGGTLIFFDQPLSWGDSYQLIGRIRRIGSKHKHNAVIRLMCRDTADEWVYKILSQEDDLVRDCLQKGGTMQVTPDLLEYVIGKVKQGSEIEDVLRDYAGNM